MDAHAATDLRAWESFYVIVGSSAAALTGLQFVVIALVAERRGSSTPKEVGAFATPTVFHFGAALLISAIASAPWAERSPAAVAFGACGLAGLVYAVVVLARARRTAYRPVLEDWIWHGMLPVLAYALLAVAAFRLLGQRDAWLFGVGASCVLLLFIGIHNAWDTVTYVLTDESSGGRPGRKR